MKYLVNRKTKEHVKYDSVPPEFNINGWDIVEADAEGWIKWEGGADLDCPISDDQLYEARLRDGEIVEGVVWWGSYGHNRDVMAYRPILDKPFVSKTDESPVPEQQCNDLLARLKSAHEAAQSIPDLLAELRDVLGSMGYDVVARNPFVERTDAESGVVESESGTETPQDMSDWRNWKKGDLVERVRDPIKTCAELGGVYRLTRVDTTKGGTERAWYISEDGSEVWSSPNNFRFHSRPEVKS